VPAYAPITAALTPASTNAPITESSATLPAAERKVVDAEGAIAGTMSAPVRLDAAGALMGTALATDAVPGTDRVTGATAPAPRAGLTLLARAGAEGAAGAELGESNEQIQPPPD
jgi:hypothetical protein